AEIDDDRPRVWWVLVTIVQWLLMIAVVAGVLWWFANPVLVLLGLPMLPSVTWRGLPAQWVLVGGGIAGGVLLGLLSSVFVNIGSRMRARKVRRVLTQRLDKVTQREILGNVDMELQRYAQAVEAISQAT
ncbi:MAG TPA: ABC transporter, partial [Propionibacteriaceae bacterium]|nr:ABC transporter [Propionibacteriaceae bacterium]HBY23147.1 ABC transporter [Propionibacteriaceae bacterium]